MIVACAFAPASLTRFCSLTFKKLRFCSLTFKKLSNDDGIGSAGIDYQYSSDDPDGID
jgi:hypothetical protein